MAKSSYRTNLGDVLFWVLLFYLIFNKRKIIIDYGKSWLGIMKKDILFNKEVQDLSARLNIPKPVWLMAAMNMESGLNPSAKNSITGATGLIQFMPKTAIALGTTVEDIYKMDAFQQLEYVEKYFLQFKKKISTFTDLYLMIFYPDAIGKRNYVFPLKVAKQNPGLCGLNGVLTYGTIEAKIKSNALKAGFEV